MLLSDFFHFNISLSVTLLQTPAEQAKVRMHLVLQAAGKWIILMFLFLSQHGSEMLRPHVGNLWKYVKILCSAAHL